MTSKFTTRVAAAATALTLGAAGMAGGAYAAISAGGGYWDRGATVTNGVWSNYQHYSKTHRSSVINGCGAYSGTSWTAKGTESRASLRYCSQNTNRAYYDTQ